MGAKRRIHKKETDEVMVKEVFEIFRIEKRTLGIAEKTIKNYEESLKRFLQILECDDLKICELNKVLIFQFIDEMQMGSTVKH